MRPQEQFQKNSALAVAWGDMTQTPEFNAAVDAAILEMVERQPVHSEVTKSWDAHSQLAGAKILVEILRNLHVKDTGVNPSIFPNLKSPR